MEQRLREEMVLPSQPGRYIELPQTEAFFLLVDGASTEALTELLQPHSRSLYSSPSQKPFSPLSGNWSEA